MYLTFNTEEVGSISFLPNGQQVLGRLPSGIYKVLGKELLRWSDLGVSRETPAVKLLRLSGAGQYYVAESAIAHRLPDGTS
jgi:hypothetical protein